MTSNETTLFGCLVAFGVIVGLVWGFLSSTSTSARTGAGLTGAALPLLLWFVWGVVDAYTVYGYSIPRAIRAGVGTVFVLLFSVPVLAGLPAIVTAELTHRVGRPDSHDR